MLKVGLSTQSENLTNSSNPPETEPKTTRTDHSNGWWRVIAHRTRHLWVGWWVSSPKPEPPNPIIKPKSSSDIWRFFYGNLQKSMIFGVPRRRTTWNPIRSDEIQRDLVVIWLDLNGFSQILARSRQIWPNNNIDNKTWNWPVQLKT